MYKNIFFRKASTISAIVAIIIVAGVLAGCQKEEAFDDSPFQPIQLSELPEGIVPLEFKNMQEALTFFNELKKKREKESLFVQNQYFGEIPQFEKLQTPRLKSGSEQQLGGSEKLSVSGWWFQSLTVYLTYESVGSSVSITSSMTGFTLSVGWEQKSYTYNWDGNCVNYKVYGEEIYYAVVNFSFFEIGRNSISASSKFCN